LPYPLQNLLIDVMRRAAARLGERRVLIAVAGQVTPRSMLAALQVQCLLAEMNADVLST
jgi:hypothetical protein